MVAGALVQPLTVSGYEVRCRSNPQLLTELVPYALPVVENWMLLKHRKPADVTPVTLIVPVLSVQRERWTVGPDAADPRRHTDAVITRNGDRIIKNIADGNTGGLRQSVSYWS